MTARLMTVSGVLALLLLWTHARPHAADVPRFDFAATVPLAFDEWVGRDAPPLAPELAEVLAADQYVHRYYGSTRLAPRHANVGSSVGGAARVADVEVDIAYYVRPQAGAAMHSPMNCLPGNGWQVIEARTAALPVGAETATVRRLVVGRGADRIAMIYWFQNRSGVVGNEYRQRLQLLHGALRGRPTDAALVRVMALDTPDGDRVMTRFAQDLSGILGGTFR